MTDSRANPNLARKFVRVLGGVVLLVAVLLLTLPTRAPVATEDARALALINARVFDGDTVLERQTLLIDDGRISAMGEDLVHHDDLRVIDVAGKTVLPGLIDAHVHAYGDALRDSLRFGVTTNLDMFSAAATLGSTRLDRATRAPTNKSDLFSAGTLATIAGGHGTQFGMAIETLSAPEQAADWVARRVDEGSDYIKLVYIPDQTRIPSLDLATCQALIKAAHDAGLMALAHISQASAAQSMLDAGIDGLVHVFADEPVSDAFVSQAAQAGLFVIPTLAIIAGADGQDEGAKLADDPLLAPLLTSAQATNLRSSFGIRVPGMRLSQALDNVRKLHAGGVTILAGADAPNPGTTYGASLHHELDLLTRAGLTPREALVAATSAAARAFALPERGVIAPGARADLVIVDGNPVTNILDSRSITHVFKNGAKVERDPNAAATNQMLARGDLSDFEERLNAPIGYVWRATDDRDFGGKSVATIEHLAPSVDAPRGALRVRADVKSGFQFPWAGTFFGASDAQPRQLPSGATLTLRLRGTPGTYRVMVFNAGSAGAPPTANVTVSDVWQVEQIEINSLAGVDMKGFAGFAIVAGPSAGEFTFDVSDIALR